jgi:hypothetical protein
MTPKQIQRAFDEFFEFPTADKSVVSSASALIFANFIASAALAESNAKRDMSAECADESPDAVCENCDCWKIAREYCS